MKKLANLIVEHRRIVLAVVLVLTAVCGFFALQVEINTDMTKYLPDDSSMKQGIDLMDEEFPGLEDNYTIRVMFTGLPEEEKEARRDELEAIPYVDEVDYKASDEDYNREQYTLYVINTPHDFGTEEELAIESALTERFSAHNMTFRRDTESETGITAFIIILAMSILMVILFAMCASWLEPFLFLAAIGVAVVINMGTNIFLGSISEVTASICSILQLVLSMDYSIILINRYRQELEHTDNKYDAMKAALSNAFTSITSSSVTTIVGLLVLVFMSFKIGRDLGIVLAKGVFISLLCIFTFLPVLILLCDKGIKKTAKKVLHIRMDAISRFSYRFRQVIAVGFVFLFAGAYFLQSRTQIAYTLVEPDPIADVFPTINTVLVLFDNDDEETITQIAEHVEGSEYVKSVSSVSTTIGKPYTSAELADELKDMDGDSDVDLDASVLDILYYYRYKNGETGSIPTGDFLRFIADDVANNETFAEHLDDDIRDNLDMMKTFADSAELTAPKSIAEIASVFDMEEQDISDMMVYYFSEYGGVETGTITLPEFVGFIKSDIMADEDFSDLLDEETLDMMDTLTIMTDRNELQKPKTAAEISDALDMDAGDTEMLMMLYQAKHGAADALQLTFPQFADLLVNELLADERFDDAFDEETRADIDKLAVFADPKRFQAAQRSTGVSDALGMDAGQAELLYMFYFAQHGAVDQKALKAADFVAMLVNEVLNDDRFEDEFDQESRDQMKILGTFGNEKKFMSGYTSKRFADLLDIKQEMADFLFAFYTTAHGNPEPGAMTVSEFIRFLRQDIAGNRSFSAMFGSGQLAQIDMLATFTNPDTLLRSYGSGQLAQLLGGMGIDKATVEGIFAALGVSEMTLSDFIDTLVGMGGPAELAVLQGLKDAALTGGEYSAPEMAALTGMDAGMLTPMFLYHRSRHTSYTMPEATLYDLVDFIANEMAATGAGGDELAQMAVMLDLMDAVLEDEAYTVGDMADLIGMEEEMTKLLFAYHANEHGGTGGWELSLENLVNFVLDDLATGQFSESLEQEDIEDLSMTRTLMQSTLTGRRFTAAELADLVEMEPDMLKVLYAYHLNLYGDPSGWRLSLRELVDYILTDLAADEDFGDMLDAETLDDLGTLKKIIAGTLAGTAYRPEALAELLDVDRDMPAQLYLLRISRYGDTGGWLLPVREFIHFIHDDVLTDEDLADRIEADDVDMLDAARRLVDSVIAGDSYTAAEMADLFDGMAEEMTADQLKLLYVYYFSQTASDPAWTFSINDLFHYLLNNILSDPLFADVFEEEDRRSLLDAKKDLDEAIEQLSGPNYSRMVIATTFPGESEDTYLFIDNLLREFDQSLTGSYYLVGNSPMNFEMSQSFGGENLFITILTAVSIFIVVALAFRSLIIPAILILVIQCGVYLTISLIGIQGYSIYYLALIIVQCILMGATIDYGILFTSYYKEKRETLDPKEALTAAYNGSIHTILTSGLIMILVTGILGKFFDNPTIGQICQTISSGALCASILIVFVLPGILATFDRWVCRQPREAKAKSGKTNPAHGKV